MKIETLKKDRTKEFVIGLVLMVVIITSVMFATSRAKYRYTQSVPLVKGTIKYSAYDFKIVGIYLSSYNGTITGKDGKKYKEIETMPESEYKINETNSYCYINSEDDIDTEARLYTNEFGEHIITNLIKRDNCYIYFDSLDEEAPVISDFIAETIEKTSITVKVIGSDNKGIVGYYYKIGEGSYEYSTTETYNFNDLSEGTEYTIYVYAIDEAGNKSEEQTITVTTENGSLTSTIMAEAGNSASDGEGTSYYYTGDPDNWVQFGTSKNGAKIWWRIIRVNGSGSVRMIYQGTGATAPAKTGTTTQRGTTALDGTNDNMYVGYFYTSGNAHGLGTASTTYKKVNTWYKDNIAASTCTEGGKACSEYIDIEEGFCNDRTPSSGTGVGISTTYYGAYKRSTPTFNCTSENDYFTYKEATKGNKKLEYPVGLITADEVRYAGIVFDTANSETYLYTAQNYWTMTPRSCAPYVMVYIVRSDGGLGGSYMSDPYGVRPVINLSANAITKGSGTTEDPYTVS